MTLIMVLLHENSHKCNFSVGKETFSFQHTVSISPLSFNSINHKKFLQKLHNPLHTPSFYFRKINLTYFILFCRSFFSVLKIVFTKKCFKMIVDFYCTSCNKLQIKFYIIRKLHFWYTLNMNNVTDLLLQF